MPLPIRFAVLLAGTLRDNLTGLVAPLGQVLQPPSGWERCLAAWTRHLLLALQWRPQRVVCATIGPPETSASSRCPVSWKVASANRAWRGTEAGSLVKVGRRGSAELVLENTLVCGIWRDKVFYNADTLRQTR
jgi:hypothetical protein